MARFLTVQHPGSGTVREKMSRFISFAIPVATAAEARGCVAGYTNEYHDARHVCWAYVVGADRGEYLSSDNGEPSGTAGRPILGQINSLGLTNVLVVVVRYFGGIKLGTPGLIAAYREAARVALEDAGVAEGREMTAMKLTFPYLAMNDVMRTLKAAQAADPVEVTGQEFDNTCTIELKLPLDLAGQLSQRLKGIGGVSINH